MTQTSQENDDLDSLSFNCKYIEISSYHEAVWKSDVL